MDSFGVICLQRNALCAREGVSLSYCRSLSFCLRGMLELAAVFSARWRVSVQPVYTYRLQCMSYYDALAKMKSRESLADT